MGIFQDIGNLLLNLSPSFRKARRIRNEIKTHHRKNLRNLQSEGPVKTYVGTETAWLTDEIERQHMDLESRYHKYGERVTKTATRVANGERGRQYRVKDEDAKVELIEDTEQLISKIESENTKSKIKETAFYASIGGLLLFAVALVSGVI